MRKLLAVLAAAVLVPVLSLSAPALASTIAPAHQTSCSPYFQVTYRFHQVPGAYMDVHVNSNACGNNTKAYIDCEYVGPHGGHPVFRFYGNQLVTGATTAYCADPLYGYGAPLGALDGGLGYDSGGVWYYHQLYP